ncbi:hypothetical protein BBJ28_00006730 [Nothophytophthora sp. Chile5]|nr:hypothetical protein BBJ28_00006730 [Nothophytophthora sp. Chile5]
MMQTSTRSWEDLRSGARAAERTLEDKIAAYTAISRAQSRSSAAAYDEVLALFSSVYMRIIVENPPEETADERELAVDIENALTAVGT